MAGPPGDGAGRGGTLIRLAALGTFPLREGRRAAQVCRPYGKNELPLYRTVPLIRHALRDTCPYPLWPFGPSSLPLLAYGHFPLTGGIGPLIRGVVLLYRCQEKLPSLGRGAPWGSRQNCTGSVGSAKAGAAVETLHLQFLQTQGPMARENTRTATQILRAGNFLPGSRDNSRNGVRGKQSYGPRRSEAEP